MDTFICGGLYVTRTCFLGRGEGGRDVLDFDLLGGDSNTREMSADDAAAAAAAAAAAVAAAAVLLLLPLMLLLLLRHPH
jgi:hypothetical protein